MTEQEENRPTQYEVRTKLSAPLENLLFFGLLGLIVLILLVAVWQGTSSMYGWLAIMAIGGFAIIQLRSLIYWFIGLRSLRRIGFRNLRDCPVRGVIPPPGYSFFGSYHAKRDGSEVEIRVLQSRRHPSELRVVEIPERPDAGKTPTTDR